MSDTGYISSIRLREEYLKNNSVRYKEKIEKALEKILREKSRSEVKGVVFSGPFEVKVYFDKIKLESWKKNVKERAGKSGVEVMVLVIFVYGRRNNKNIKLGEIHIWPNLDPTQQEYNYFSGYFADMDENYDFYSDPEYCIDAWIDIFKEMWVNESEGALVIDGRLIK